MYMDKTATWPLLPTELGTMLTACASGWFYSFQAGNQFVEVGAATQGRRRDQILRIGFELIHQAWDTNPGDVALANQLLGLDKSLGGMLSPAKRITVNKLAETFRAPADWREERAELAAAGGEHQRNAIEERIKTEPANIFWWYQAMELARADVLWDWMAGLATSVDAGSAAAYTQLLNADARFHSGDYAEAMSGYRKLRSLMEWPGLDQRTGECLLRMGERDSAFALWRESLRERPWQTNMLLRLHDIVTGADAPGEHPDGSTFLLLYSWNKAESLDRTLRSLAASDIGGARIKVLDNGSTDATPDVVRAWAERLGPDRFEGLSTLVNVGAPAARNWLMHLPDVRQADNAIYMDDDIVLPHDWLAYMGAAQRAYPDAKAWGCRIIDDGAPHNVQHTDEYLAEPTELSNVGFCCQYLNEMDFGQFSYLRPSFSVTGCLHLFRVADLHELGGFDLHFSPSQFDDAERDVRINKEGGHVAYQGHLAISHERNTGSSYDYGKSSSYGIDGNFYKLNKKYDADEVNVMRKRTYSMHLRDIRAKYEVAMGG